MNRSIRGGGSPVDPGGRISMKPGVTSGETTITLTCDGVAVSVDLKFIVVV